jgi:hypothetical protein
MHLNMELFLTSYPSIAAGMSLALFFAEGALMLTLCFPWGKRRVKALLPQDAG